MTRRERTGGWWPIVRWSAWVVVALWALYGVTTLFRQGQWPLALLFLALAGGGVRSVRTRRSSGAAICLSRSGRHGGVRRISDGLHLGYGVYTI